MLVKNKYNIGLEIFFINSILVLYILTSDEDMITNYSIASISSLVALIINIACFIKSKTKKVNIVFLLLNIIVLIGCITMLIKTVI